MFLIIAAVIVGILVGLSLGGSFKQLSEARFRWWPLALLGFALQLIPVPSRPGQLDHWLAVGLLIASYVVLLTFVALNLRYVGFWLVAAGFALNLLVIGVNGGMPVGDHALRLAYGRAYSATLHDLTTSGGAKHHLARPDDVLLPLTDVIPVGAPVHNVFAIGDIVAMIGVAAVMAEATKGRGSWVGGAKRGSRDRSSWPPRSREIRSEARKVPGRGHRDRAGSRRAAQLDQSDSEGVARLDLADSEGVAQLGQAGSEMPGHPDRTDPQPPSRDPRDQR